MELLLALNGDKGNGYFTIKRMLFSLALVEREQT